jgi:hypothetical protein
MIRLTLAHSGRPLYVRPESILALCENFTDGDYSFNQPPTFRNTLVFLGGTESETFCVQERAAGIAQVIDSLKPNNR